MKCKFFIGSDIKTLNAEIKEWMDKKGARLLIKHIKQSECAYPSSPAMPSFHRVTISIWYDMQGLQGLKRLP